MLTELYGTLYGHDNLHVVMTMLKDIYAKKPQNMVAIAARAAQGATAPFTHICSPTRGAPKAQSDASLEDRILQLTETLYHIDLNGKPTRKPFKPFITQPRRRFKPGCNGCDGCISLHPMEDPFHQIDLENNKDQEDASDLEDPLESLTKAPMQNVPESLANLLTKTEFCCFQCKEFGHMQKVCPELNKPSQEDNTGPKKFEEYTYTYSGPDVQPHLQMNQANLHMATTYDQTLGSNKRQFEYSQSIG